MFFWIIFIAGIVLMFLGLSICAAYILTSCNPTTLRETMSKAKLFFLGIVMSGVAMGLHMFGYI